MVGLFLDAPEQAVGIDVKLRLLIKLVVQSFRPANARVLVPQVRVTLGPSARA